MPSLESTLAGIPGLSGYLAKKKYNDEQLMGQLQQVGGALNLGNLLRQQGKQQQYEQGLAALGENPDHAALISLASRFAGPEKVLDIHQKAQDRAATVAVARESAAARNEQAKAQIDMRYDQMVQQATNQADRNALEQRRIADKAEADKRHDVTLRLLGEQRADIAKEAAAARADAAANKPMTEFQGKAALYGTRAAQSDKVLKALEDKVNLPGLAAGQATGMVGNVLMSSEQQRVDQAQRDFVNAILRQESGAVISDAEFANAKRQYFPMAGDSKAALDQKRANRQLAIQGFARMSGPKGASDIKAIIENPLLPGVNPNAVTPQQNAPGGAYIETRRTADGRVLGKKADGTIEEIK